MGASTVLTDISISRTRLSQLRRPATMEMLLQRREDCFDALENN